MRQPRVGLVNSIFSQDAGPPILPTDLAYWRGMLPDTDVEIHDLNLGIYRHLDSDITAYHLLGCIFGGYTFSFPLAAFLPFSEFRFEALPTLPLLLFLIYAPDHLDGALREVARDLGLPHAPSSELLSRFLAFAEMAADQLSTCDVLALNMPSPGSVLPGVFIAHLVRQRAPSVRMIAAGSQINVPEVARLALSLGAVDQVVAAGDGAPLVSALCGHDHPQQLPAGAAPLPDFRGFPVNEYPVYHGLPIVPLATSRGCPRRCNFCSERLDWDSSGGIVDHYSTKPIHVAIEEIQAVSSALAVGGVTFGDCLLPSGGPRADALFPALAETGLLYSGAFRADELSEQAVGAMAEARFTNVIIGLETLSPQSVSIYEKGDSTYTSAARRAVPLLHDGGILAQQNILICHPYESLDDVASALNALLEYRDLLASRGVPFARAPVGTVVVNYPSTTYFRVLRDACFTVVRHHVAPPLQSLVPPHVAGCVEQIPHRAIRSSASDEERRTNKLDLCAAVYALWSGDDEGLVQWQVSAFGRHGPLLLESWERHQIRIRVTQPDVLRSMERKPNAGPVASAILHGGNGATVESVFRQLAPSRQDAAVQALLSMSVLGIVELARGGLQ